MQGSCTILKITMEYCELLSLHFSDEILFSYFLKQNRKHRDQNEPELSVLYFHNKRRGMYLNSYTTYSMSKTKYN